MIKGLFVAKTTGEKDIVKGDKKKWLLKSDDRSPEPSDIIWTQYCTNLKFFNRIFAFLLTLTVIVVVIKLVNPVGMLRYIQFMSEKVSDTFGKQSRFSQMFADQLAPMVLILFNYVIIP